MKCGLSVCVGFLVIVSPSHPSAQPADSATVAGIRGAFVGVPASARTAGLAGACTAVADDPGAVLWNPAGLAGMRSFSVAASWNAAGAGVGLGHLSAAIPSRPLSFGLAITALSFGSYDIRGADGIATGSRNVTDLAATAGAGMQLPLWLGGRGAAGVSAEIVSETGNGRLIGFGAGALLPLGAMELGVSVAHLGPQRSGFGLPASLQVGILAPAGDRVALSVDAGWGLAARQAVFAAGAEVQVHRVAVVRAGYQYRPGAIASAGFNGIAAGAGFRWAAWALDYAFQPHGELATSHRVSLGWSRRPSNP